MSRGDETGAYMGHTRHIINEFTHQSAAFNVSPVMSSAETLQALIDFMPLDASATWLEVACGPGIISRSLATRVARVVGVDVTPAMVELGRREALAAGLTNVSFAVGDATRLALPDSSFDGAVTRFSLHHIPLPWRVATEMARAVRPGGWIVLADHITSDDMAEAAWHQEIERLRDPSHWACLTPGQIQAIGARAGLTLHQERLLPFSLDFDEWLQRGSGGPDMQSLIQAALETGPARPRFFSVAAGPEGTRRLHLRYHLSLWQR